MNGKSEVVLAPFTTFHVGGPADIFYEAHSIAEVEEIVKKHTNDHITVLGGGSNVLIADEGMRGVVVRMMTRGVSYEDRGESVRVVASAGESWDAFVADTIAHGAFGLENLSGIPGTVGASPVQNIGAYGAEVKDVIEWVEVFDKERQEKEQLQNSACAFGYRDSIFKTERGKKYIVTRVSFLLSKKCTPNVAYKDLETHFGGETPRTAQEVRDAVLSVRAKKFPDLSVVGTAGSFFKNPVISEGLFSVLRAKFPDIKGFPAGDGRIKIPLAWILDNVLHLNGKREGNVSCFQTQPLVLCAYKGATAREIDIFAKKIEAAVRDVSGINIEREVQMLW